LTFSDHKLNQFLSDFTMETSDGPGTPVSTQMNLNKTRPINEVDNSPLFDDESDKALRTKVLNLEIENEAQKSLIDKLTNKLNDLVNKVLAINTYDAYVIEQKKLVEALEGRISSLETNFISSPSPPISQIANSAPTWVTVANKNLKPDQRSNQKPAMSEYQINVLNSASDEINEQERRKKNLI
ncbi:hypothetical protein BpHYR1_052475, partial [Brachionus plicatilis]